MRIIARRTLVEYWVRQPETEQPLLAWFDEVRKAEWRTPAELKATFGSASILKNGRVVFNVCGNKHRLVAWVNYEFGFVYVKFVGTHAEYDRIDAETISFDRDRRD